MEKGKKHFTTLAVLLLIGAGCTSQAPDGKDSRRRYANTRHSATGSNIPQPDRGVNGNNDASDTTLQQEQFRNLQMNGSGGMPRESGGGR